ncbi:hypothetical protein K5D40_15315 [Pseudomonas cichorii]|nr:hypothetical protein [Pseudomonas cichorii]MBX8603592.1 hypothetical protein [Pseudomonas cichorii]
MQGRTAIEMIVKDVEELFTDKPYSIDYIIAPRGSSCQKLGERSRIIIDHNISLFTITDLTGMMMVMIEVCHEVAHYLNRHAIYISGNEADKVKDDKSLEIWADFFGAKLIMTLVLLGSRIRPAVKKIGYTGLDSLLESLNQALLKFYSTRYADSDGSPIYEKKDSRVGLCVAGINSVLDRAGGVDYQRSYNVFMKLHRGTAVLEKDEIDENYMQDRRSIGVAFEIMKNLQIEGGSMFDGMNPFAAYILGAGDYNTSEADRIKYVEDRKKRFLAQGFNFD